MIEFWQTLVNYLPTPADLVSAIPVIVSLVVIEGLLSVDNAMAIAAMPSGLPKYQQTKALRLGIVGAYLMRGLCLGFAAWIAGSLWIKAIGAMYLIYLMVTHIAGEEEEEIHGTPVIKLRKSLVGTVIAIEIMDLSLSLDNVVAAVAMDKRLWVVCLGVFIGILALRFLAGYCIRLIEKFPVLKTTAFLLVGFVGVILLTELACEEFGVPIEIGALPKFIGIMTITASSLLSSETKHGRRILRPVVLTGSGAIHVLDKIFGLGTLPLTFAWRNGKRLVTKKGGV